MRKSGRLALYKTIYSKELVEFYINNNFITWKMYKDENVSGSLMVQIKCIYCGLDTLIKSKSLHKRVYQFELCNKCSLQYVTKTDEWREKNKKAQLKIQSTPEQKLKNSIAVSNFWKNNEEVKEKMKQNLIKKYQDKEYKDNWIKTLSKKTHSLSGLYKFDNGMEINFGSAYELCFLDYCEHNQKDWQIYNADFSIPYEYDERTRHYIPDFILQVKNKKIIVEIKSTKNVFFNLQKQLKKTEATLEFIKQNNYDDYWFIDEEHKFSQEINFRKTNRAKTLCKILSAKNKIILFSDKKKKVYIGE